MRKHIAEITIFKNLPILIINFMLSFVNNNLYLILKLNKNNVNNFFDNISHE